MSMKPGIYGPDDPEAQGILNLLKQVYAKQAEQSGRAEPTEKEGTIEAIAWNAVVMGHPNRFSDSPEAASFAALIVKKLGHAKCLRSEATPYATNMVAGLLRFLWDTQNLMYLDPQFARGQAGAFQQMIDDANKNWVSVETTPWLNQVAGFPAKVDAALKHIESQTYEGVYDVLDPSIDELKSEALKMLEDVEAEQPDALPGAAAFLAGTAIVKNTYSPLDGSVPESIGERLKKLYHAIDADNQRRYFPYLDKGFQQVRNQGESELDRWQREDS